MSLIVPKPHPYYHPVIKLPKQVELYDFSQGYTANRRLLCDYGIGKYNEHRPGMYTGDLFEKDARDIHMGIDIGAPVGTPVYAFDDGYILHQGYNPLPFDYGHVIVTEHKNLSGETFWVLLGHLSKSSLNLHSEGDHFQRGDIIGWIGDKEENGGWNAHLHIQMATERPQTHDLPGTVNRNRLEEALKLYPDPQMILGELY